MPRATSIWKFNKPVPPVTFKYSNPNNYAMNHSVSHTDQLCFISERDKTLLTRSFFIHSRLPIAVCLFALITCYQVSTASAKNYLRSGNLTVTLKLNGETMGSEFMLQQTTITGTVTSLEDQTPLPGVSVVL